MQYEAQIAELEGQVEELKPFKAEAEQLRADIDYLAIMTGVEL